MKLGIMQPYFFPYLGYWQLMNTVDQYVIYDDVNYIKGGWINRNRILSNGKAQYFNVPMLGASPNKLIKEIEVNHDKNLRAKNMRTIEMAYGRAPYFNEVYPLIEKCLNCEEKYLSEYIIQSIDMVCEYLGIGTQLIRSSSLCKDNTLKGQDKVLQICRLLHADEYYNAIGGKELYQFERFAEQGIRLHFLKMKEIQYSQFGGTFVSDLSIIDVLMFNPVEEVNRILTEFVLDD